MITAGIFPHIPESLVVVSPEYIIIDATDMYLKATMRKREDIVGKHFLLEAFPEPGIKFEDNPVKHALDKAKQTLSAVTLPVIKYDIAKPEPGEYDTRYWETVHTPIADSNGEIIYLIQTARDVTERELASLAQKSSEDKFQFLTDSVPQLIHTATPEGEFDFINQRWLDYTGKTEENLKGAGWQNFIHPEDLRIVADRQKEVVREGTEFQAEVRIRNADGGYRWHLLRSIPMKDENGRIIMRVGSSNDIHSTKEMVQELLESNERMSSLSDQLQNAYQKAEDQRLTLENLIMQVPAVINITKGPEHRFELVNPQYQRLFPKRELVGKTTAEALPEAVEQGFIQILDNVYNTREPFIALEIPFVSDWHDDGNVKEHYFTITYLPLIEHNDVTGIITFGYIISDKVMLRKELEALKSSM